MKNIQELTEDWKLYEQGIEYNYSLSPDYYATVNRNNRVYNNQHFDGVNLKGLRPFVIPMSQRAVRHLSTAALTDTVKAIFTLENYSDKPDEFDGESGASLREYAKMLESNNKERWERLKIDSMLRRLLKDGALSGDMATHTFFDDTIVTGQTGGLDDDGNEVPIMGDFITEAVDGVNVFLGNPNDPRINVDGRPFQPYVIISGRETVDKLRKEAKRYNKKVGDRKKEIDLTDAEIDREIMPDEEYNEQAGDRGKKELENRDSKYGKATYIIKYWVDDSGKVLFNKSVRNCYIRKDVDTELGMYPVAWANWDTIKNSYHGQAVMTGLVNNQLEIDKAFARLFKYIADMAFPKTIANKSYFPNGVSNKINEVIYYEGSEQVSPSSIYYQTQPAQLANHVIDIIIFAIEQTLNLIGVSDAFLGSAKPENTSALIQQSKNSAIPLNDVQKNLYQLVEDQEYIWLEFMIKKYKVPRKIAIDVDGVRKMAIFDPAVAQKAKFRIRVDVGAGSLWDAGAITQTMFNMFREGMINAVQAIKRMPDNGSIPEREALIKELEAKQAQIEQMQSEEFKLQAVQEWLDQMKQGQTAV